MRGDCCGLHTSTMEASNLSGKTLLIVHEGGFGDSLQVLCFVRPLTRRAARVTLSVPPKLVEFVRYNLGESVDVVAAGPGSTFVDDYQFDEYIWGWSTADLFEALPAFEPLHAPTALRRSMFDRRSLQIGICWAAADWADLPESNSRSISDLTLLEPLLSLEGVDWHNLQVGASATQAENYPKLRYPNPPLTTFADTANLIAGLDAIVTVDTAVCHLAGRLGTPTFALLRHVADDRWGFGETTPWYPSMRLIREHRLDDWPGAIGTLANHLSSLRCDERPLRLF
jgi:hypothetical protein